MFCLQYCLFSVISFISSCFHPVCCDRHIDTFNTFWVQMQYLLFIIESSSDVFAIRDSNPCGHISIHPYTRPVLWSSPLLHPFLVCILSRCPCVCSQSTSLLAGSSWCLWKWPASVILLNANLSHSLGSPPYRCFTVTCSFWLMFSITHSILVFMRT